MEEEKKEDNNMNKVKNYFMKNFSSLLKWKIIYLLKIKNIKFE